MKIDIKKTCIVELITIIILSFTLFVFNFTDLKILAAIIVCVGAVIYYLFRRNVTISSNSDKVTKLFVLFSIIYLVGFYLLGTKFGFKESDKILNLSTLFNYILPIVLIICISEKIRQLLIIQNFKLTKWFVLAIMVLIDVTVYVDIFTIDTYQEIVDLFAFVILSSVSCNMLYTYVVEKYGIKSVIAYRLITTLYSYVIPIIPDIHVFIRCVLRIIYPYLIYQILEYTFIVKDAVESRSDKRKTYMFEVIILSIAVAIAMLISCQFKFGALVIATTSMTGTLNKGDVIIYERLDSEEEIKKEDIIVFKKGDRKIVHRIVGINVINNKTRYITKGDANHDKDKDYVLEEEIVGLYKTKINSLGYPSLWVRELINNR